MQHLERLAIEIKNMVDAANGKRHPGLGRRNGLRHGYHRINPFCQASR